MQRLKCVSLLVACAAVAPVCANTVYGNRAIEEIAGNTVAYEADINAAKAKCVT